MVENGVERAGIGLIRAHIDHTKSVVHRKNLFPALAAIGGLKNSAVGRESEVGIRMPEQTDSDGVCAYDQNVGIARVDDDGLNVADVGESNVLPGGAAVSGAIDSVTSSLLAGADENNPRIGGRDGHSTDRS